MTEINMDNNLFICVYYSHYLLCYLRTSEACVLGPLSITRERKDVHKQFPKLIVWSLKNCFSVIQLKWCRVQLLVKHEQLINLPKISRFSCFHLSKQRSKHPSSGWETEVHSGWVSYPRHVGELKLGVKCKSVSIVHSK